MKIAVDNLFMSGVKGERRMEEGGLDVDDKGGGCRSAKLAKVSFESFYLSCWTSNKVNENWS